MQLCIVSLHTDGLSFRWEDESKSLQASVFLRKEVLLFWRCSPFGAVTCAAAPR